MPAVHENYFCPACMQTHAIYLPRATAPDPAKRYEMICPCTGIIVRYIGTGNLWKTVDALPADAVVLRVMNPSQG
jgi:hypothetical protein